MHDFNTCVILKIRVQFTQLLKYKVTNFNKEQIVHSVVHLCLQS